MILILILPAILLILTFIIFFVVAPWRTLNQYKAKGYSTYYFPILGEIYADAKRLETSGDVFARAKEFTRDFPNQKVQFTNAANKILVSLNDPLYIKEFLLNPNLYRKAGIEFIKPLLGEGLVLAEGETWKRHRKIISNPFHFESLKANIGIIRNTTLEFLNKTTPEELQNYSVINKIQEITGEIVGRIFFGENLNSYTLEGKPLTLAFATLVADVNAAIFLPLTLILGEKAFKYPIFKIYKDLKKRIAVFRALCFKIVEDHKKSGRRKGNDLLSSLLAIQDSSDPELGLSDKDIVDEFITFFVAGMDTTGQHVGMALYNLTQHPDWIGKLQAEIQETYDKDEALTIDTLQKMDDLHNVLKETLRMYPPAPATFPRVALVDHKIGGELEIKKGTWLKATFVSVSHDERHFIKPDQFNPSRWRDVAGKLDTYAYTPFSAGPRNCIGQHLATVESKIIMSEFLKKFDFKLKEGYKLKMERKFLYQPVEELIFELTPKLLFNKN